MKILGVLMLAATLLGGCATTDRFDARACPDIKTYSKIEQQRLLVEYQKAGPTLKSAMRDYLKLRDKARACRRG